MMGRAPGETREVKNNLWEVTEQAEALLRGPQACKRTHWRNIWGHS